LSLVLAAVLGVAAAVIAWILARPAWLARRRARLRSRHLSEGDRMWLRRRLPLFRVMPQALQQRLEGLVSVFLAEKAFVGCRGLQVTRLMQLTVASQACLLVLGRDEHVYDALRSILLYPSQFVVRAQLQDEDGVVTDGEQVLSGEAWDVSRIVLSWEDVTARSSGAAPYNVVIHEFAHYLDHAGGLYGTVRVTGDAGQARRAAVLRAEFDALRAAVQRGEETFLDPYGAEDEAEFFAVATEGFFEAPAELARLHPALYGQLRDYYRLHPASWA
jgi:Mlc titration factor MtfA (ptsG expression regulator)